jgi:hypothetical protein
MPGGNLLPGHKLPWQTLLVALLSPCRIMPGK